MIDDSIFSEIADTLGLASPAIPEKDYYAIQLLKCLEGISSEMFVFVFVGGTCLSKVHINTYRMSEDVDIKLVPKESTKNISKAQLKKERKEILRRLVEAINSHPSLSVKKQDIRNEYCFQQLTVEYPKNHELIDSLRTDIRLDVTEAPLVEQPVSAPISSFYAQLSNTHPEIKSYPCATVNEIASEKFVGLLRRVAYKKRDKSFVDDPALVRHVYDLKLILSETEDFRSLQPVIEKVISMDKERFCNRHKDFIKNPLGELQLGLNQLTDNPIYMERYGKYIAPLSFKKEPVLWQDALSSLQQLMTHLK